MKEKTIRIRVFGIVQSVGFRPTVSRHAAACHIHGSVSNMGPYVEIMAQGRQEDLDDFVQAVRERPPKRAVILRMDVETVATKEKFDRFEIAQSGRETGDIFVSPDIAICDECKKEMYDKKDRRYLHPFINCTCCGPRLTILDGMPYDRERTSMKDFPMCPECEWEYTHPQTRRYDAQPVCCHDCGPEVYLMGRGEKGLEAIQVVRDVIRQGGIAAVKGIGGFHLCCDAANENAVRLLRERKRRPAKPFAVMVKDEEVLQRECMVDPRTEKILTGHQKPIVLLERNPGGKIAPSVAPDNPKIGVMLPYAPVQLLLFDCGDDKLMTDCLVMTSANTSGAPICRDDEDARKELSHLCDVILSHDRPILIRADDTVIDLCFDKPYMIRRSRGYAPLPFMTKEKRKGTVLGIGGELKNTFCIGKNQLFYPSPYVGDMGDVRTIRALDESVFRMLELLEANPQMILCDLHPGYNTTVYALELGKRLNLPVVQVQHHYAHVLSCMAENDTAGPVIGVSMDGTGYGTDQTIWGGEILLSDTEGFERVGSIEPLTQIGGDASAKEGWRIAMDLLLRLYGQEEALERALEMKICSLQEARVLAGMKKGGINAITSTSAGRLFDGVSALLGIRRVNSFEGEASMTLQFAAMRADRSDKHNPVTEEKGTTDQKGLYRMPSLRLVEYIIEGIRKGKPTEELAWDFHAGLAGMILEAVKEISRKTGIRKVVLSGGVFQNTLLVTLCTRWLEAEGYEVYRHHLLAPNDGGICLGQALYGMKKIEKGD